MEGKENPHRDSVMPAPSTLPRPGSAANAAGELELRNTRIETAGVMRCCLATVAEEYEGGDKGPNKPVAIGMKSQCRHCKRTFTLVEAKPLPTWKPDTPASATGLLTLPNQPAARKARSLHAMVRCEREI